ncbi:MAG: hypothetical protein ACE5G8_17500, partial [Anaerolineae bacterium]
RPAQFLAVVGASGSGKSSLVRAGLIPALQQGTVPGSDRWAIHVFKPGSHPLKELAAQLSLAAQTHGAPPADRDSWLADLRANGHALHRIARQLCPGDPPARRLLLVVDQFEELFTLCRNHDDRRQFIENLLFACSAGDGRVIVLLTLRADFYHRCAAHRGLAAKLAARQILLEFMNRAELRRAIEQPARQVGLNFEPGLVDTILTDVTRQPGALPLLQHALLELWERRAGRMLTRQAYRVSGGVQGAIARRAEALYTGFDPPEQAIVRRIMLRLTQPGDGTQDTRRRARKQDLLPAPGSEQVETVETVLQQLTGARLLTVSRDMATGHDMVDVSHEALIAGWERLQSWIDEDRLALRTHRRLTDAAHEWEKENRDPRYLSHGVRLAQAEEWAAAHPHDLSDLERAYLQAGRAAAEAAAQEKEAARRRELAQARALAEAEHRRAEEQTRAGKRLRWLVAGLAVVFAVAVLAAALAVGQQQQARRQAATAQARRDIAQALQITAEAARATAEHETISRATAQANAETEARARATAQAEAEHRRAEADAARAEAERQHQLSLSRQLAAQSQTFQDERFDLALL